MRLQMAPPSPQPYAGHNTPDSPTIIFSWRFVFPDGLALGFSTLSPTSSSSFFLYFICFQMPSDTFFLSAAEEAQALLGIISAEREELKFQFLVVDLGSQKGHVDGWPVLRLIVGQWAFRKRLPVAPGFCPAPYSPRCNRFSSLRNWSEAYDSQTTESPGYSLCCSNWQYYRSPHDHGVDRFTCGAESELPPRHVKTPLLFFYQVSISSIRKRI